MTSIITLDDDTITPNFVSEEWIGLGKKYSSKLPGYVQHAKNFAVAIPISFQSYFPHVASNITPSGAGFMLGLEDYGIFKKLQESIVNIREAVTELSKKSTNYELE
ncbi:hypothetical protein AGABI2DRAFT_145944 [Agaricus bisporus var. bisporus H97]|uniref:hypothetical protein n=1 Tax=Agaricus bisporus var. bisporus (strain H97 / ATCC MYA-4626 / FGSC 10389) TaxID=936046 RepID=UPI00029F63EA|nr:hypothetical protein AGABI2DRAFT_145944 [Agaricus bisporus var. bisporus H97]EKV43737.1 hypothetical protein AGABI2DRAFT_145944 [Agaricus bisporus var. bisporus H97]